MLRIGCGHSNFKLKGLFSNRVIKLRKKEFNSYPVVDLSALAVYPWRWDSKLKKKKKLVKERGKDSKLVSTFYKRVKVRSILFYLKIPIIRIISTALTS